MTASAPETVEDDAPEIWQVRSRDGKRVMFEGIEDDARAYVQANFPHVHAEPNTHYPDGPEPDVYLHGPDDTQHGFVGGEWSEYEDNED